MSDQLSGFLLVNKPTGPTSHDIIYKLRKITGIKKIGHAGTLDPFASGLLIVAIGRESTREISNMVKLDKIYRATVRLGESTDSYDRTGKIISTYDGPKVAREQIDATLVQFRGKLLQIPPMYSAKKVNGQKLYELARKGIEIERQPSEVEVHRLEIKDYAWPVLTLEVHCSSGTYIRSLARDLGEVLGCGAHLAELERTAIGKYDLVKAATLEELAENWQKYLFIL